MLSSAVFWKAVRKRPTWLLLPLFERGLLNGLGDGPYLKLQYWAFTGERLCLSQPKTFNEKIAWLKVYDHRDIYRVLADKGSARKFVSQQLGEDWLVPQLGLWDKAEEMDFSSLPEQFVLKCTHGYGGTILCRDKAALDIAAAKASLQRIADTDFYGRGREWAYYHAQPRIIAEQLVDDGAGARPADYKFMCFQGTVKMVCISRGLGDFSQGAVSFFYPDGTPAPFKRADYPQCPPSQGLPSHFQRMKAAAETLAQAAKVPFVRVDFYEADGRAYFSEFTFYPCGGSLFFDPPQYNSVLGELLVLPARTHPQKGERE